jgi:uncharacterized membrane protein
LFPDGRVVPARQGGQGDLRGSQGGVQAVKGVKCCGVFGAVGVRDCFGIGRGDIGADGVEPGDRQLGRAQLGRPGVLDRLPLVSRTREGGERHQEQREEPCGSTGHGPRMVAAGQPARLGTLAQATDRRTIAVPNAAGSDRLTEGDMSDLIVATFTDDATAGAALDALRRLRSGGLVAIEDAAIVRKDEDGKTRVKNSIDEATVGGAVVGAFLGAVFLIFFPLIGIVGGAVAGGLVGHSLGRHVEKSFVDDVSKQLESGQSALFVLLSSENADAVIAALRPIEGGTLVQTTFDPELEQQLAEALK